jgi:hypothetical protein
VRRAKLESWDALAAELAKPLGEAAADGVLHAKGVKLSDDAFQLANADAVDYAADRAAELVGRHQTGAGLTEGDTDYAIDATTRDALRVTVTQALDEGWSADELGQAVEGSWAFSADRAETIARTELALAHTEGNLAAWQRSGVVTGKRSILSDLHDRDDLCNTNAAVGVIPLGQTFPSGHTGPPYHPNCECALVPEVAE